MWCTPLNEPPAAWEESGEESADEDEEVLPVAAVAAVVSELKDDVAEMAAAAEA